MAKIKLDRQEKAEKRNRLIKQIKKYKMAYMFLIPAIILTFMFQNLTTYGVLIAFKDFKYNKGILGSPWVGFQYFSLFLRQPKFWDITLNTLKFSFASLIFGFPAPIILALMINEVRLNKIKRVIQTVSYLPHFVSWVVVISLFQGLLSPYSGLVNEIRANLLGAEPIYYFGEPGYFLPMYILIGMWKEVGWCTILYLATMSGIDLTLYEAAAIDGAGRLRQTWNITLPSLIPIVSLQLIMQISGVFNVGFEQIYLMQTPATIEVSEVISTYLTKMGLQQGQYSLSSAIGLTQTFIGLILMVVANKISKKLTEVSMW